MRLLSTSREDARALAEALDRQDGLVVVCFCAAWCYICNDFRSALARIAQADTANGYVWLDIEDDAALADDIEIDNFPTFAVYRGGEPLFFGVTRAEEGVVARTIAGLAHPGARVIGAPEPVAQLPRALAAQARAHL